MRFGGMDPSLRQMFRRFWPSTCGSRRWMLVGGFCAIVVSGGEIGTVVIFEIVTNDILSRNGMSYFWPLAAVWVGAAALTAAAMFVSGYFISLASEQTMLRLRDTIFCHAQKLSLNFFSKRQLGDLMVRLIDDVEYIEAIISSGFTGVIMAAASVALFVAAAFVLNAELALVTFGVSPIFWFASKSFSGYFDEAAGQERKASSSITSVVEESLANQALVQAFNRQRDQERRLHEAGSSWLQAKMREIRLSSLYAPLVYFVETVCVLVVFGFGAWEVSGHRISFGGLLAFAILLAYIYPEVQELAGYRVTVADGRASARRVAEILDREPPVADAGTCAAMPSVRGSIEFDGVTFSYPDSNGPVLRDLSFVTGPGRVLAVLGPSGSGKSTVAGLLLRFYDPDSGRVLLDGHDLRDYALSDVREAITLLHQESLLFAGTVRDNLAYGRPEANEQEIVAAARAAGAHDFITALPDGYETPVGQRGRSLSGGQRQRIAVARAVLRDARVLVLDEPTTGLDSSGARHMMRSLAGAMAGRTTVLITHDPYLAEMADDAVWLGSPPTARAATRPARSESSTWG